MLSQDQARELLQQVLSYTKADEAEVSLSGGSSGNLRFAQNMPTTSGQITSLHMSITCVFGRKIGSISTNEFEENQLKDAVGRAEELARLAPESPEYMPRLGPQSYLHTPEYDEATPALSAKERAQIAGYAIEQAVARKVVAGELMTAGFFENGEGFNAMANSRGLFAYRRSSSASYTLTVRTSNGGGSGWGAAESHRGKAIDPQSLTARAIDKAIRSRNPVELKPGAYRVVLEPSAAGDMLNLFSWNLDRRSADEGRSFFSDPEKGTKLGQKLFGDNVTIYSDPTDPAAPSSPWGEDGLPLGRTEWVKDGVLRNLAVSRYWAQEKNLPLVPYSSNIVMEGEEHSIDDLVAATDYGLLVTSFWYIREVDPQTILNTGLTRDGLFLIENGKITTPVVNFRWNESPASIFTMIEMMSRPERAVTREGNSPMLVPALKIKEFRFTSVSPST